ncbi:phosphatase PAP2 family protein [Candidatus Saccharibacteria bacterium]|nr:phosphatase PAP2 family protein [Candidatus Saccharibacteria bacterium]
MKRIALIIGILCLAAFFIVGVINFWVGGFSGLDDRAFYVTSAIESSTMTVFMRNITRFGSRSFIGIFCLLVLLVPKVRLKDKVPILFAVPGAAVSSFCLKYIFAIDRPDIDGIVEATGYSFPSNHTTASMALYVILLLLVLERAEKPLFKITAVLLATVPILVGISRVYLGAHFLGDVLAGWFLGAGVALTAYVVARSRWLNKFLSRIFPKAMI